MTDDKKKKNYAEKAQEKAEKAKVKKEAADKKKAEKDAAKQAKADAKKAKKKGKKGASDEDAKLLGEAGGEEGAEDAEVDEFGEGEGEGEGDAGDAAEEEEDLLGATAEELLEEEMDVAVRVIQDLYRRRRGMKLLRELVRANFMKEYDQEKGEFFYRNVRTGKVQLTKPLALGAEDLPDPPVYFAPKASQ